MKKFAILIDGKIKKVIVCADESVINVPDGAELLLVDENKAVSIGDGEYKALNLKNKVKRFFGYKGDK